MLLRLVLAVVGCSAYLLISPTFLTEFWARYFAWITPHSRYVYSSLAKHHHRVRTEFPDHPEDRPAYCISPFASSCTYGQLAVFCFPLLVSRLQGRRWNQAVWVSTRAAIIAISIAFVCNALRLAVTSKLSFLEYPEWMSHPDFFYHDIPNYLFFLLGAFVALFLGLSWLRSDFCEDRPAKPQMPMFM